MNNIWLQREEWLKKKKGLNQEDSWATSFNEVMDMIDEIKTKDRHGETLPSPQKTAKERALYA